MSPPVTKRTNSMKYSVSRGLNKVCVSRGLNNVCVSQSGLKAQRLPSPGQAKRRPGFGMRAMCAPCKGKSLRLLYTFAPSGRSYICLPPTQGAATLALGYVIAGLSARSLSCDGSMAIIKFKTTHTTFTTFYNVHWAVTERNL